MVTDSAKTIRVLLIDDHAVVRAGLRMLIESRPEMKIVGEAGNGADAVKLAAREQPDIILLDLDIGGESGLDVLPKVREAAEHARVLILTGTSDTVMHQRAVGLGALGIVLKEKAADMLLKAITKVHEGEVWLDNSMMSSVLAGFTGGREKEIDPEQAKIATLTPREREIISLIGEGLKNKQIADRLFISETTVRNNLTIIYDKLDVSDRLELVVYAYRYGLVKLT